MLLCIKLVLIMTI